MTPRRIDYSVIARRLRIIEDALETLGELHRRSTTTEASLTADPIRRAATERLIQVVIDSAFDINAHIIVSLANRAPETGRQSFLDLCELEILDGNLATALAPAAGLRNILVHNYVDVRIDLVASSTESILELFPEYVRAIARASLRNEPKD